MDIRVHKDTAEAYSSLHTLGFKILAADLGTDSVVDPHNLKSLSDPLALVFGNEESGVSEEGRELADGSFFIPMCGFTQSLNLSVTVAVALFSLRHQALTKDMAGDMDGEEQAYWYDLWVRRQSRVQDEDALEIYDAGRDH
jgi:tRNA (guanosine-2'-O-)-methyltransferase